MDIPRRRAEINGLFVTFESRNPKLATIRWHPRFKMRYRTKADALEAKQSWEKRGRILWPEDFKRLDDGKAQKVKPREALPMHPRPEGQQEMVTGSGDFAVVAPTLVQVGYGERDGQAPRAPGLDKPLGTCVSLLCCSSAQRLFREPPIRR